jgi:hypothetical protein
MKMVLGQNVPSPTCRARKATESQAEVQSTDEVSNKKKGSGLSLDVLHKAVFVSTLNKLNHLKFTQPP